MAGLTFILSGGAAVLTKYGGHSLELWEKGLVLSVISGLWLVVAIYFLGDISAHFNPAATLAFALRRDMEVGRWSSPTGSFSSPPPQGGSLLARAFFGPEGKMAATLPQPGQDWQAVGFEAIITFGLILMVVNLADGPKLNGPFVPLAVGAYVIAWATMGGPYEGAAMNPARAFGPDVALANLSTWWIYLLGPSIGAVIAVGVAYVLRRAGRGRRGHRRRGNAAAPGHRRPGKTSVPTGAYASVKRRRCSLVRI